MIFYLITPPQKKYSGAELLTLWQLGHSENEIEKVKEQE
jgi:hypothetical protein